VGKMMLRGEDVGQFVRWVLHDARIFGGNSGGPLVNTRGEVVASMRLGLSGSAGRFPATWPLKWRAS
jgi:serine protease Do